MLTRRNRISTAWLTFVFATVLGLAAALLGVVSATMRPDSVNLWIRRNPELCNF